MAEREAGSVLQPRHLLKRLPLLDNDTRKEQRLESAPRRAALGDTLRSVIVSSRDQDLTINQLRELARCVHLSE